MRKRVQPTLTIGDFKLLMKYYFTKGLSVFNKRKLFGELNDARIVSKGSLLLNVARQGAKILVRNIGKHQTYRVHIVAETPDSQALNKIAGHRSLIGLRRWSPDGMGTAGRTPAV